MIGLTSLEINISTFNITEKKVQVYQGYNDRFPYHSIKHKEAEWSLIRIEPEVLFEDVKDEIAKALDISNNSDLQDLQDETTGPLNFKDYEKLIQHDGYEILLGSYIQSKFQNFKSYLRTKIDWAEEDIELILKQFFLNFIKTEIPLGVHTTADFIDYIEEFSKGGIKIGYDDITKKTKLFERSKIIRCDNKGFFYTFWVSDHSGITSLIAHALVTIL